MNARLRQVVADKDELIASQDTLIRLQQDQLAGQDELLVEQARLITLVEEQNAALRRQVGLDSTNSSTPPSADSIGANVYTARTDNLIWYGAHQTRSHAAVDGFDILPRFAGVLIRDDWHGYHKYSDPTRGGKVTQVQLCCAHLLRDLKAVWESDPEHQAWAEQMRQTLKKARRTVDTAITQGAAGLSTTTSQSLQDLYLNTAQQGIDANTPGTAGRSHDAYKLAKRMRERVDQVLNFTLDFHVEWTNNPAEQAIRMAKLQAKISGSWRSMRGLTAFCRVRSYIATAKAHGVEVFTALRNAFLGDPWSIATPA
ncbi:transposase [Streptomyces lunaelactis]|uniref:IS66 family transposase n=1 Tax=Streptomyces lunaelactis TaxID=1535768 RepID=UPI001584E7F9|nr:transposase [Streptomyces lunaelactis]NUL01836.1 transposase [Streptomyces lunaelactis]